MNFSGEIFGPVLGGGGPKLLRGVHLFQKDLFLGVHIFQKIWTGGSKSVVTGSIIPGSYDSLNYLY